MKIEDFYVGQTVKRANSGFHSGEVGVVENIPMAGTVLLRLEDNTLYHVKKNPEYWEPVIVEPKTEDSNMTKYNFKVGDRIKDSFGKRGVYDLIDGKSVCRLDFPENELCYMAARDWELDVPAEPAHESDWSYAEAERLQKAAHDAIDAYNEYVNAKPNTVFLTIFK